ncbi:MAG: TPM domain-containing protein [Clostridia bacterium]
MKNRAMMKKWLCGLLCALVLVLPLGGALGAARMPANRGVLTDDANVLSGQTAADIASYAELAKDQTGLMPHVVIVHFLDGLDAQTYVNELFANWNLQKNDILLLGAAGEDSFAIAMGKDAKERLGQKNAETLLYTSSAFGNLFRSQQYDEAFGAYFVALNTLLNKQCDTSMKLGKLFAGAQEQNKPSKPAKAVSVQDFGSAIWNEVLGAMQEKPRVHEVEQEPRVEHDNGMGAGGWIVLLVIIGIIFGQSDPVRRARRNNPRSYRSYGCGCSPLGWLFSIFGLNVLIDSFRKKR